MKDRKEYYKKYYREHRDKRLAYDKQYYEEHQDEELAKKKQYYKEHRDEELARGKQYREKNQDYFKQYREQNKDKYRQARKVWQETHREQRREIVRRHNSKRKRGLGFIPLNEPFENSEAHHIDEERVIYIPKEYHKSVSHNVWTGKNMALINALAWDYLLETKISIAQGGAYDLSNY